MEEICGFLDKNKKFHKTKKECEKANLDIEIQDVQRRLNDFSTDLDTYIFKSDINRFRCQGDNSGFYNTGSFYENKLKEMVIKAVLLHSDSFLEIISKKKEVEKTLDILYNLKEYRNKWWMNIIWWK